LAKDSPEPCRSNGQALDGSSRFRRWVGSIIVTSGAPPERHTQLISTAAVLAPSSPCLQPRMATYRVPSGSAICSDHRSLGSASARIGAKLAVSQFPRTTIQRNRTLFAAHEITKRPAPQLAGLHPKHLRNGLNALLAQNQPPVSGSCLAGAGLACCRLSKTRLKYSSEHERCTYSSRTRNHCSSSAIAWRHTAQTLSITPIASAR
jgi:hypothetical protein